MQKILVQIVQHLRPGGLENMAIDLCRFAGPDYKVHLISLEGQESGWRILKEVPAQIHLLKKAPGSSLRTVFRLARLLREIGADIVHTHHVGPLIYGGLAARLAGVSRVIHTEHDAWHLQSTRRRHVQNAAISLVRPVLVADAPHVAANAMTFLPGRDYQTVLNGIDCERFVPGNKIAARTELGLPTTVTLIGCSARLEPVKGVDNLVNALAHLPDDIHLAVAGQGSQRDALIDLAQELDVLERIHLIGHVDDMPRFYQALDLFCLPSRNEGLPLSPLEAQSCGIPAVVMDVGAAGQTLCPETGHLVPADDLAELTRALRRALDRNLKCSPRSHVEAKWDVRKMAAAYRQLHTA
jgi:glycosyltransferase involved in cell wall biosynthesis